MALNTAITMQIIRNIFEVKSSRIVRVLLTDPRRTWVLRGLAEEAQVSLGLTFYVTSALIQMGFGNRDEKNRFILTDANRLIRQWAASHNYLYLNKFSEYYTFDTEFDAFVSRFGKLPSPIKSKYALTLHAAAWLIAPYVKPTDFHIYVHPDTSKEHLAALVRTLEISPVEKSGNAKLVTPYDEGVFYCSRLIDGVRIASPVQIYVDLFNHPGRGEEAAQKLLERINKEWHNEIVRHQ
jgi:hypothetical protein